MLRSPKTKAIADGLIERTSSMLEETASKDAKKEVRNQISHANLKHK